MKGTLEIPITLQKAAEVSAAERAAAWFMGSGDVPAWIEEVASWENCDQEQLRFHPVPESSRSQRPTGVVITLESGDFPAEHAPWRGLGLRRLSGKLLVPMDAELRYPVSAEEVRQLVPHDCLVLLPGDRRITFDRDHGLRLHELIAPISESTTDWNQAIAADDFVPRLQAIGVMQLPDFDEVMESGKDDIGDTNPDALPKRPGESTIGNGLSDLGKLPGKAFFNSIKKLAGMAPKGAKAPTWIDRLDGWASQKLGDLVGQQSRELDRLLDLMKSNPDRGLNFALPLTGEMSGRGREDPGGSLGWRNVSFTLGSLFGSGEAISSWMLPGDRYLQLQNAYREAANRELKLGRYRRAAYIFGQLLGDLKAAANALEQGGFYREAAVIYERKLNDRESAAEAYRKGGLFEEALRLYRELGQHEVIAELLLNVGRKEEALEAYEVAIWVHLSKKRLMEAARIALNHLDDGRRAIEIYRIGWPGSRDAGKCLRFEFELLAEGSEHEEAEERIEYLAESPWTDTAASTLVSELNHLKRSYPHAGVVALAGDAARRVVGYQMATACRIERPLLGLVGEIDPGDPLLKRDARRFADRKLRLPKPDLAQPGLAGDERVAIVRQGERVHSPGGSEAIAACGFDGGMTVAKVTPDQRMIVSFEPAEGVISRAEWPLPYYYEELRFREGLRLFPVRSRVKSDDRTIVVTGLGTQDFRIAPELQSDVAIGSVPSFDNGVLAVACSGDAQTWILRFDTPGKLVLENSYKGEIGASYPVDFEFVGTSHMICSRSQIFIGSGERLFRWHRGELTGIELPSAIIDLAATRHNTLSQIAIGMEVGAAVAWGEPHWDQVELIGHRDLENVRVGFTSGNHLVLAGHGRVEAYSVGRSAATLRASLEGEDLQNPLCVAPLPKTNAFDVVTEKRVISFELHRS